MARCTAEVTGRHDPGSQAERDCPRHGTKAKRAALNAAVEPHSVAPLSDRPDPRESLTEAQERFFENSVACDERGNLVKVFHGSAHRFSQFDPSTLGRGNDSWGNGFYFTTNESTARGYAADTASPDANVGEFYLNLTNPIVLDGQDESNLDSVRFDAETSARILMSHPLIFRQPSEEGDDGEMNPLGDYAAEYWDKDSRTRPEMEALVRKVAREYFNDVGWTSLESFFGRDFGAQYLEAVREATGHDGVVVDFGEDGKHYVAWFANQMKLTSNTAPDDSPRF